MGCLDFYLPLFTAISLIILVIGYVIEDKPTMVVAVISLIVIFMIWYMKKAQEISDIRSGLSPTSEETNYLECFAVLMCIGPPLVMLSGIIWSVALGDPIMSVKGTAGWLKVGGFIAFLPCLIVGSIASGGTILS